MKWKKKYYKQEWITWNNWTELKTEEKKETYNNIEKNAAAAT